MKTNNTEGLTMFEINVLVQQGGKFVIFPNTISKLYKKFKLSNIYFVRPNEPTFKYALKHFFLNLSLSWRIIPYGPIYVLKSFYYLIKGGKDYTQDILNELRNNKPSYTPDLQYLNQ
ncbi:hypothetical protein HNP37_003175 [Flavobacterium nitrogenifigens]|uniref:Uncharacterized protein n=2 Tax=Flavobacterium TaxID=237 RepID=A0A7W7J046_9FLAO|nr:MULTISPECIES: hypothetical protein [Flavobacterium]MBB4803100.1 hypothetical protein [Flavobacterium nitrogenifigens]MBB6388058.1 hypothetical protein [Flavobacterium notoginsengisoli]